MDRHIPSPWGLAPMADKWGKGHMICGDNGKGKYVAHVYTDVTCGVKQTREKWKAIREANLGLLLSAPDLLEALEALLAHAEPALQLESHSEEELAAWKQARTALAKAKVK